MTLLNMILDISGCVSILGTFYVYWLCRMQSLSILIKNIKLDNRS